VMVRHCVTINSFVNLALSTTTTKSFSPKQVGVG
jgi:hypothetical protein